MSVVLLLHSSKDNLIRTHNTIYRILDAKINELLDYCSEARTREEIQEFCGIGSREYLMANVVRPLLESGRLRRTIPDKPSSSKQNILKHNNTKVVANSKKAVAIVTALYHLAIMSLYGLVP